MAEWSGDQLRSIVRAWASMMEEDVPVGFSLPAEAAGRVLREGASDEEIAAADDRLGVRLPVWYREFLSITDGAWAAADGPALARHPGTGLLRARETRRFAEADPSWLEVFESIVVPAESRTPPGRLLEGKREVHYHAYIVDGIAVSGTLDAHIDLLVPVDGRWEFWVVWKDGATAFPSIAWMMVDAIRRRPKPIPPDELIRRIHNGDINLLDQLVQSRDPRAAQVALEVLDEPPELVQKLYALRSENPLAQSRRTFTQERRSLQRTFIMAGAQAFYQLKDPLAIEALRRALTRAEADDARLNALAALVACGAPDARELLKQARDNDESKRVRDFAAGELARSVRVSTLGRVD
jgi:hypothetical protein